MTFLSIAGRECIYISMYFNIRWCQCLLQVFDKFLWFCHQQDENLPLEADGSLSLANATLPYSAEYMNAALSSPSGFVNDLGGCFRQGPGPLGTQLGSLTLNTINMHENETYNFTVIVFKGSRSAVASLLVDILPGRPPSVAIR